MRHWEQVHTEEKDGFTIHLDFSPEDTAPDWDMTKEERDELIEKIDNGSLLWVIARVEVKKKSIVLGSSYLGGCCYKDTKDFLMDGYYEDMVNEAMQEAKDMIEELAQ